MSRLFFDKIVRDGLEYDLAIVPGDHATALHELAVSGGLDVVSLS